ncbi:hypothetical protein C5167_037586 [Papaver somniferum]|uniref:DNA replication complex GINS protein PSF2 n=1 Tax=Papaver somniferum TaxID=3469 RepID=A0A4Y7IAW1_PAPSO|nr:hypothetical protein C5167_037586 [Papaver somniferum]
MAGQSDPHLSIFSAAEVEFLAEDELVEIIPNMTMDSLNFICGDFGPFFPHIPTEVPIWLAMALKKRGKCGHQIGCRLATALIILHFIPPNMLGKCGIGGYQFAVYSTTYVAISCQPCIIPLSFLLHGAENLTQVLEAERDSRREFQPLPFHYVEISRLLFDHARDDIPDVHMVRTLVEDIRDVRFHKVESGFETIGSRTHAVKLKNLSAMEVNIVRPFFVRALQAFYKHDSPQMIPQPDTASRRTDVGDRPRRDLRPR